MPHKRSFHEKLRQRTRSEFLRRASKTSLYPYFYSATWRAKFSWLKHPDNSPDKFITAVPNAGAGIGHQMANWIAGLYAAEFFGLRFAHSPFPAPEWEAFLGLGGTDPLAKDLVNSQGYRKVRLPRFDFKKPEEVARVRRIITSYTGKVCFFCEMDQFFREQHQVIESLQARFHGAVARESEALSFHANRLSIAVHVRRGDICQSEQDPENTNLSMRWLDDDYFLGILEKIHADLPDQIESETFIFTQGNAEDYEAYTRFPNTRICTDMGAIDSFRHMVFADVLVTSRSSFSYKPALLSRGIKICPAEFWHGYPDNHDWSQVDRHGRWASAPRIPQV